MRKSDQNSRSFQLNKGQCKVISTLTVDIMHSDSLMAPQHPKNAIKNTAEPITMNTIGYTSMLLVSSGFSMSW